MTFSRSLLLASSLALLALGHPAAAERIPLKDFFDNPKISSATISPDGKRYAFLAPDHGLLNVWVVDVDKPMDSARLITHDTKRDITSFDWTRDSRYVVYEQDQGGDENFHLFRADPLNPDAPGVDLTPMAGARAEVIDLPRKHPEEAIVAINGRDKRYFDVYRLNIADGKLTLLEQNPGDVDEWYTDLNGDVRACVAQVGTNTEIRVRDTATGPFRKLATYASEDSPEVHAFGPDGTFLYFSSARDSDTSRLVKLDLKTGKESLIDSDPQYDVDGIMIDDRTNDLMAVVYDKDHTVYKPYDKQLAHDLEVLGKLHAGDILFRSSTDDQKKWIIAYNSPTDPGATYLYDRDTGKAQFLYRPRPWLPRDSLVDMQPVSFPSRDGLTLHGYLTLPKGVAAKNLPTILVVHGGPWARDDWGYDPEIQFLANRGYAVLQINYRGSTGYGKKFLNAGDREWGGKMLDDLIDGVNWLVSQGIANKNRVGIYGGSYGGYATLAALAFRPHVFACGVDYVGISNLLTFMKTIPPYWDTFRQLMYKRVGDPDKDQAFLKSRSPLFAADQIQVPLFVAQGYNDPRVNHAESEQIVNALKSRGKPVEYMLKMDEGHGFENPQNSLDFYSAMEKFFEKYL